MSLYNLSFVKNDEEQVSLEKYRGKKLLLVNTASFCGSTPQYKQLQDISTDIEIIAFPCNQFGNQEPGTDEAIKEFCSTKYGVTFPISKKIEVNGPNAHPIYKHCKSAAGVKEIGWNFEKFLVSEDGGISHYNNTYSIADIIK